MYEKLISSTGLCLLFLIRYIIKALNPRMILATVAIGPYKGNEIMIPRISFHPEDRTLPIEMERRQFPVRLCFAVTSNKSQGQTLRHVGIYLEQQDFFAHGQPYVAVSRVQSSYNLKVFKPTREKQTMQRFHSILAFCPLENGYHFNITLIFFQRKTVLDLDALYSPFNAPPQKPTANIECCLSTMVNVVYKEVLKCNCTTCLSK